jgi:HAD superfamily hydrolase (TIGR01549 family)
MNPLKDCSEFGILFDLDGVLLNSLANMKKAWDALPQSLTRGVQFLRFRESIGLPFPAAMESLGIFDKTTEIEVLFKMESSRAIDSLELFADIPTQLATLSERGFRLGLYTSKDCDRTHKILAKFGLKFDFVLCPNNSVRGKPYPDQIFHALKIWGLGFDRLCYFGDTLFDYEAAKSAGARYFHCQWGYGAAPPELNSDSIVPTPRDIAAHIEEWSDSISVSSGPARACG